MIQHPGQGGPAGTPVPIALHRNEPTLESILIFKSDPYLG